MHGRCACAQDRGPTPTRAGLTKKAYCDRSPMGEFPVATEMAHPTSRQRF